MSSQMKEPRRSERGREKKEMNKTPQNLSAQQLFNQIRRWIIEHRESQSLTFENVEPEAGSLIVDSLNEDGEVERLKPRLNYNSDTWTLQVTIMPTHTHECPQRWFEIEKGRMIGTGFLNLAENMVLGFGGTATFRGFTPPFASSRKEPDQCIVPEGLAMPTVVIESGWSESHLGLLRDTDLWLRGGAGNVQLVFVFNWTKLTGNRVKGVVEVYNLNQAGNVNLIQAVDIFPRPAPGTPAQHIAITRGQLFGPAILAGRNPNNIFNLLVDDLRRVAIGRIQLDGYVAA